MKFEINLLNETAENLNAKNELDWAIDFINRDRVSSFERTRNYLIEKVVNIPESNRLNYILKIWNATNAKGYITEMEALALIRIAKDWKVEVELIKHIRKK